MTVRQTTMLSAKIALLGSVFYLAGLWLVTALGWHLSSTPDWLFRLVLVFGVVLSVTVVRGQQNGYLSFSEGVRVGSVTTLMLAIGMAVSMWLYATAINPPYAEEYREAYYEMQYNRTMQKYINDHYGKDTMTQGAIDTVQRAVTIYVDKAGHFFTRGGQTQIVFGYALIWGMLTTLTVVLLARRVRED